MSPLLLKGLIGVGAASIVGTSGWGISKFLEPKTLGEYLTSRGDVYPPMVDGSELSEWKQLAKKYKDNTQDTALKFSNLTTINNDQDDGEAKKLMNECRALYAKNMGQPGEENDIKKLRKWCAISTPTSGGKDS